MADLGLFDLLAPYFVAGVNLGDTIHDVLAKLHVDEYNSAFDEEAVTVWGVARFDGDRNPQHTTPRDQIVDWHDTQITFRLTAPRAGSTMIHTGVEAVAALVPNLKTLVDAFGAAPDGSNAVSDYPDSQFRLEVLVSVISIHLPRSAIIPATLEPNGLLKEDPSRDSVKLTAPRILFVVAQGGEIGSSLSFDLESWGAEGLDDFSDVREGVIPFPLPEMDPPYALVKGDKFGFGFRKAILDLSDDHSPPEVLSQFGAGDDWQGIYMPELRIFVSPGGTSGLAVDASARNLLIGLNRTPGVSGDFELDVINQGQRLNVHVRFYDSANQSYAMTAPIAETFADPSGNTLLASAALPASSTVAVDVSGGMPPYTIVIDDQTASAVFVGQTKTIATPEAGGSVHVHVTDTASHVYDLTIATTRSAGPAASSGAGSAAVPAPVLDPTVPAGEYTFTRGPYTETTVTLNFSPPSATSLTYTRDGTPTTVAIANGQVTIPLPSGSTTATQLSATWPGAGAGAHMATQLFFRVDHPNDADPPGYALQPGNVGLQEGPVSNAVDASGTVAPALSDFLQSAHPDTAITIHAFASAESNVTPQHNTMLGRDRAAAVQTIFRQVKPFTAFTVDNHGDTDAAPHVHDAGYDRASYWRADVEYVSPGGAAVTVTSAVHRPAVTAPPAQIPDNPPQQAPTRPSFFRSIGVLVRIQQDTFIALEVKGEVDVDALMHDRVSAQAAHGSTDTSTLQTSGAHLIDYDLLIEHDDSKGEWTESIAIHSGDPVQPGSAGQGLYKWFLTTDGSGHITPSDGFDLVGLFIAFAPLLNDSIGQAAAGNTNELLLTEAEVALVFTLAALGFVHTKSITWYGGQIVARERTNSDDLTFTADIGLEALLNVRIAGHDIVTSDPQSPVRLRYAGIGMKFNWGSDNHAPVYQPVFDSSKGFSLDISDPGALKVAPPLDKILQILGARIARTNPLNFELDLGLNIDLGIISVDRIRIRMPLDPAGPPQITALGVGVDIPNALKGHGYLQFDEHGFMGQIDITLVPLKVRIAAGLAIEHAHDDDTNRDFTAVLATLAVEFPAPIVLGASGIGIYGFLGLFAMHFRRNEDQSQLIPALDWFANRAHGDPTHIDNLTWVPAYDHWAFGVGVVLGTLEGAYVINLKGMFVLELPGPRLLILVNANLIKGKPATKGTQTGTILCIIDLDFERGRFSIGMQIEYKIEKVLDLRIPADALFNFHDSSDWQLDIGRIAAPATATIFDFIRATAYLEIHGNGIADFPAAVGGPLNGFSIAAGMRVSVIWGDEGSGLYLKIVAGMDVGVSFSPFHLGGRIYFDGELHLWIVGLHVSGDAEILTPPTFVHGHVCGEVDFFFFSLSACVDITLGDSEPPLADAPNLIRGMSLISRSPALVAGTGVDRPIDGSLGEATAGVAVNSDPNAGPVTPNVPIDSIPVLHFEAPPVLAAGFTTFGAPPASPAPKLTPDGWVSHGKLSFRYTLKSIAMTPVPSGGAMPETWRTPHTNATGDNTTLDLALLDWIPTATPKAVQNSTSLTEAVNGRWGSICDPVAPAASVLWTFRRSAPGPSATGWIVKGIAWPDPPHTRRSVPAPTRLLVKEAWRSGNDVADALAQIAPAEITGLDVAHDPCGARKPNGQVHVQPVTTIGDVVHVLPHAVVNPSVVDAAMRDTRSLTFVSAAASLAPVVSLSTAVGTGGVITTAASADSPFLRFLAALPGPKGFARVLRAPYDFEHGQPSAGLNKTHAMLLKLTRPAAASKQLEDGVIFDAGGITHVRFLLLVPGAVLKLGLLMLRSLNKSGAVMSDQPIVKTIVTDPVKDLPKEWLYPKGPWYCDVVVALEALATYRQLLPDLTLVFADVALKPGTARVELGLVPNEQTRAQLERGPYSYFVGVVEARTAAEDGRAGHDDASRTADIQTIDGVIANDPASLALLAPNRTYTVTAAYDWQARDESSRRDDGTYARTKNGSGSQQFTFTTDGHEPSRLDSWILCASPSADDKYHFFGDPLNIVFSTNGVIKLFNAYGKTLRAVVRSAAFRPTPPLDVAHLETLPGFVLDPWEETLGNVLDGKTCTVPYTLQRHGRLSIASGLDPLSEYIVDLEVSPANPISGVTVAPLFRRSFGTSRYQDVHAFANAIGACLTTHRRIAAGRAAGLAGLAETVTDAQLEQALVAAGLGAIAVPAYPQMTVIWEDGPPATPVAIMLDTPEPHWRVRDVPTKQQLDANDPESTYWVLAPATWLRPVEVAGGFVNKYVRTTNGARTLLVLRGARGHSVTLALAKTFDPLLDTEAPFAPVTIATQPLPFAPWEDPT